MSSKSNEVREALHRIVAQEGPGCLKDVRRFRSLWLDYAPAQSKEAKLILSAVQEGVGGILINALDQDDAEKKRSIKRCEQRLADAYITGDGARFAVREIASALRMDVDRLVPLPEAETVSANQLPQRAPKAVPADQTPEVNRKSTSSPQDSPQILERETTKRDPGYEEFLANNAAKEAPMRRKKSSLVPLLALMLAAGAAAGWFLNKGSADVPDVPAVVAPADAQNKGADSNAVMPPILPVDNDEDDKEEPSGDEALAVVPPVVLPEQSETEDEPEPLPEPEPEAAPALEPEPVQQTLPYEIDTIASNLSEVYSMVMNNEDTVYYTDGKYVYSSKSDKTVEITGRSDGYLAHNPDTDAVYLITNRYEAIQPTIYDITGFDEPDGSEDVPIVLDEENCPALSAVSRFSWPSGYTKQIGILKNGALLVPCYSGTYMINIDQKTVTQTQHMYGSENISVVVEDAVVRCQAAYTTASVTTFDGTSTDIEFEREVPNAPLYSRHGTIYCYDASVGVCCYNTDGTVTTLIPKESIQVKDYQSLNNTNFWGIAVGSADCIALYDHSLECIRLIRPVAASGE